MLNSIDRAAQIAGVALESVDLKDRTPWGGKDLRQKSAAVGLEQAYLAVFGGMSHNAASGAAAAHAPQAATLPKHRAAR